MTSAPSVPSPSIRRSRRPLVLAVVLLVLGIGAAPASAASVIEGSGADARGDAPSSALDIVSATAVFNRSTGRLKATVQMAARPTGDVDIQYGVTQPGGACAPEVTLRTNVADGKTQLYGSAGNVRKNGTLNYQDVGFISAAVTDDGISGKAKINCFAVRAYGAGANHQLRDTLGPVALAVRPAPPAMCDPEVDVCDGTPPVCDPEFEVCPGTPPPCDPTVTECPDAGCDPTVTECPDTGCDPTVTECPDTGCDPTVTECPDTGCDPTVTDCPSSSGGQQLSVRFYGIPKKLRRGRSYDIRIRLRNNGDQDARKLKVRLAKKPGVAMSRRVASVSNVRSGKGITVHVRVRLTSSQAQRTVRVSVTGAGVSEQRSFVLRRRGAK